MENLNNEPNYAKDKNGNIVHEKEPSNSKEERTLNSIMIREKIEQSIIATILFEPQIFEEICLFFKPEYFKNKHIINCPSLSIPFN